ncbi:MAG TPA: hypothetical protein VGC85_11140 [Chthoniobacterales bacterium]
MPPLVIQRRFITKPVVEGFVAQIPREWGSGCLTSEAHNVSGRS